MGRTVLAVMFIASLAPCAACAQGDADQAFAVRAFRSNFLSAFDTRSLRFVSVPMGKNMCTDEALARLSWRDAFVEALLLDWGKTKDEYARIMDRVRKTIEDMYVPLAFEIARTEDGACSIRTFFASSNEVEEKLNRDEQERLRNWLPSVHAPSAPVHDHAAQQVSATAADLAQEHERSQGLERDLTAARNEIRKMKDAQRGPTLQTLAVAAELSQERERSNGLDRGLAAAREEVRKLKNAQDGATQQISAAAAELSHERERSKGLQRDLAAAREEIRKLKDARGGATQQVSGVAAELAKERERSQELNRELAAARVAVATPSSDAPRRAELDAASPPTNEDKLLARAHALVLQGNIDGARLWLERAVETGSARAEFDLAQTYDPDVLSIWKTYGVRGDVAKARELYSRAYSRGITEAKERIEALE